MHTNNAYKSSQIQKKLSLPTAVLTHTASPLTAGTAASLLALCAAPPLPHLPPFPLTRGSTVSLTSPRALGMAAPAPARVSSSPPHATESRSVPMCVGSLPFLGGLPGLRVAVLPGRPVLLEGRAPAPPPPGGRSCLPVGRGAAPAAAPSPPGAVLVLQGLVAEVDTLQLLGVGGEEAVFLALCELLVRTDGVTCRSSSSSSSRRSGISSRADAPGAAEEEGICSSSMTVPSSISGS